VAGLNEGFVAALKVGLLAGLLNVGLFPLLLFPLLLNLEGVNVGLLQQLTG
jgi:hypothetical protein